MIELHTIWAVFHVIELHTIWAVFHIIELHTIWAELPVEAWSVVHTCSIVFMYSQVLAEVRTEFCTTARWTVLEREGEWQEEERCLWEGRRNQRQSPQTLQILSGSWKRKKANVSNDIFDQCVSCFLYSVYIRTYACICICLATQHMQLYMYMYSTRQLQGIRQMRLSSCVNSFVSCINPFNYV